MVATVSDFTAIRLKIRTPQFAPVCMLGWLVDPQNRRTYVYSANGDIQTVKFDGVLSDGEVMPGLEVRLVEVLGCEKAQKNVLNAVL
ncbi:MAG: hypothetical protein H7246_23425 [Phycisphaerae bacterium]|nr:hypothetical protein [Saprospiraceae bacterium]